MSIKIIDNKKVELTDSEWNFYQQICSNYDRGNTKGSDLFSDTFEVDQDGIIVFIKPPTKYISMEIYLFICSIFQHQYMRLMNAKVEGLCNKLQEKIDEVNKISFIAQDNKKERD